MTEAPRAGRPRASSRETLAEAACELFLEQGYEATSVADITRRAGVSRSSFFNYFTSKSDVLWSGLDERITGALDRLDALPTGSGGAEITGILSEVVHGFAPDPLALALRNSVAMGLEEELIRDTGIRQAKLAQGIAEVAHRSGIGELRAAVTGAAYAGAVMAALRVWAVHGAGQGSLEERFDEALRYAHDLPWAN